jgi:LysR family hydrogen peroxide-inducible transcriptional activator
MVVPVPFAKPVPTRRVALAYRRSFPRPAAIKAIRDAVAAIRSPGSAVAKAQRSAAGS